MCDIIVTANNINNSEMVLKNSNIYVIINIMIYIFLTKIKRKKRKNRKVNDEVDLWR